MQLFYTPRVEGNYTYLEADEAHHCIKVLRHAIGDAITCTDGRGNWYETTIERVTKHEAALRITKTIAQTPPLPCHLHLALAPTKNIDRTEWFVEKAVEMGVSEISLITTNASERRTVRLDRLEGVALSAVKQSLKGHLPRINGLQSLTAFLAALHNDTTSVQKFIAHCREGEKMALKHAYTAPRNALILIGPEGDFEETEITAALAAGCAPVSLGNARLRTETAALAAVHTVVVMNT